MRAIWPPMLPVTLQFIIVMIASAINDRLQRKLDYVEAERRIPQEQLDAATGGKKLSFTADQRRGLSSAGKFADASRALELLPTVAGGNAAEVTRTISENWKQALLLTCGVSPNSLRTFNHWGETTSLWPT